MQRKKERQRRKKHNIFFHGTALFLSCLIMATCACSSADESAKKPEPVQQTSIQPSAKKENAPTKKAASLPKDTLQNVSAEFTYDPTGKPDPFLPLITETVITSQSAGTSTPDGTELTPLQKYDLSEIKLVAIIIRDDNSRTAMVEDKAGYGYILKKGMLIGKNNGTIKEINPDNVQVEEKIVDPSGSEKLNTVTLNITKTESGGK